MRTAFVRHADRGGYDDRTRLLLRERVDRALSGVAEITGAPRVERVEVPAGRVDPVRWLFVQEALPRMYWSGRDDGPEVAVAGSADLIYGGPEDYGSLQGRLSAVPELAAGDPRIRYYGGLRFDPGTLPADEWRAFGAFRFVLPRFELVVEGEEATLVCNLFLPRDAGHRGEILEQIDLLPMPEADTEAPELPLPVSRTDTPDYEGWKRNVEWSLSAFAGTSLEKVVLARRAEFEFAGEPDATALFERLKAVTPGCSYFYVEPEAGAAFIGASPERLFRREGPVVRSEAVAGTRPRSDSAEADAGLRDELLGSEKDLAEHGYVRRSIRETLAALCESLEVDEATSEMKLARGRHLVSRMRGVLREGVGDADLLRALHPTPAVGGYPKAGALAAIPALEPFDRGLYAGPVGWIGGAGAEFAVGIRSGLVRGERVALFSGAGIVAGSTPEGEWAEIEQKIGDFTKVFGLEPGTANPGS